jgi:hypothetical protein
VKHVEEKKKIREKRNYANEDVELFFLAQLSRCSFSFFFV